jgi:hypothetical protein
MSRQNGHRTHGYTGLAADPDTATIERLDVLRATIGNALNGRNTAIVGVDRGDPTRSLTGPIAGAPSPTNAYAVIAANRAGFKPTPTIQDVPSASPDLDPYNALLLARMKAGTQ